MQLNVSHFGVIENRATEADAPGVGWPDSRDWYVQWQNGVRESRGDVVVNTQTALSYSVFWRCVVYISSSIAALCWDVFDYGEDGKTKLPVHDDIAWTLEMQANPEVPAFEWRQSMLMSALTGGNGYSEIERTNRGKPVWAWQIDRGRVNPDRTKSGALIYEVENGSGIKNDIFMPQDIFHLRGPGGDGIVGWSPVTLFRRSIELAIQQEVYGVGQMRQGPRPGGFLKVAGAMKEDERRAMSQSFSAGFGGARNAGKVPVLSGGMDFTPFAIPNTDQQFIESRQLTGEDIARIFGCPQHKVGILTRSTNNNIEQQSNEAVFDCLWPWCRRLEVQADLKLYGLKQQGRRRTKLGLKALLKGDSKTLTENLARQVQTSLATPNEAREELDRNPVPDGDELLIQGATITLERALEEPPEPAPAPAQGAPRPEPDEAAAPDTAALAAAFAPLLAGVYSRQLKVEHEKAERAEGQGRLSAWAAEFYGNGVLDRVAAAVRPVLGALALAAGLKVDVEAAAAQLATDHVQHSTADVALGTWNDWADRPAVQTRRHLAMVLNYDPDQERDERGRFGKGGGEPQTVTKANPGKGTLPDGKTVEFIPHPNQRADETTTMVSAEGLEKAWEKDDAYIPPGGGGGEIGGRRAAFERFLETGKPVEASRVTVDEKGNASFIDGRHRFSVLRDKGIDKVAVTISKKEVGRLP